jgi:hypothetical protein
MNETKLKDIGDTHSQLGREALRAALDTAAAAALETAAVPVRKSGISEVLPPEKTGVGDSSDKTDLCAEDSGETTTLDEPFPLDCLPGSAGDMAREVTRAAMVPDTLAGMNVIGILSASIGAGLEVCSGGDRRTRANLFLMPVAASGTGKGQSFGDIAEPFLAREALRVEQWRKVDRPEALTKKMMAEEVLARLKSEWRKDSSAEKKRQFVENISAAQAEIDEAEKSIREPAWSTEQATKESIEDLFRISTREQLASLSAEARGAADILMGRYNEKTDESIFLSGYSGDRGKITRKGAAAIWLNHPCLMLLWMLQPDKLREMLESPAMSESGLLPRFLLADTKAEPQEEPEERQRIPDDVKAAWAALVHDLLNEYHEPDAKARVIEPEREAAVLLRDYNNEIVRRRRRGGDLADVSIYAARWAENAWRLALVLHAATHGADAWCEKLSADTADKAVKLMRWFSAQQLRVLAAGREDRLTKRLERLREVLALKPDKCEKLSELERRNGLDTDEVQRLAAKFPAVVVIEKISTGGAGRPSVVARLLPEPKQR